MRALQGLHFLYPMCEGADPEPQCLKERRTSGYLRLLITVALPYFLMSLMLFLVISAVRCHQRRQLQEPYTHVVPASSIPAAARKHPRLCLQELEERVANVRERGRVLTDFLYAMSSPHLSRANASPSPAGARPRTPRRSQDPSPLFRCTMRPGRGHS